MMGLRNADDQVRLGVTLAALFACHDDLMLRNSAKQPRHSPSCPRNCHYYNGNPTIVAQGLLMKTHDGKPSECYAHARRRQLESSIFD